MNAIKNSNELVYLAAASVIQEPAKYSPMFFYSKAGTDKTHLLKAIVKNFKKAHKKPALYITAQKFIGEFISSFRSGWEAMELFKQKYRNNELLILDDFHLLAGRYITQEQLLMMLKEFQAQNRQIILSANCHPNAIPGLNDILRDSCQGGLMLEVRN